MILGLTGPICAGKDEAGKIFSQLGFERLSLVEALRDEARARGIELTRNNLQDLGDSLRAQEGVDTLARRVMARVKPGRSYVIESIRNPGEVLALRTLPDFVLVCVTASDQRRFERMVSRGREQDPKTFEDFLKVEARDRGIGQAAHAQQSEACWKMADITLTNDATLDELQETIKGFLSARNFVPQRFVQVMTALPDDASAKDLIRGLLETRVIACGQILSAQSLFWWNGKIQEVPEHVCLLKGTDAAAIEAAIRERHPYEIPEIIRLSSEGGNSDYTRWLSRETAPVVL